MMIRPIIWIFGGYLATMVALVQVADCDGPKATEASKTFDLIPVDGSVVDVMEVVFPERMMELSRRLQAAASKDPAWFLAHVRKATPGEPLPYDSRFGISAEEYEEYLKLGNESALRKAKYATLRLEGQGKRFQFDGGKELPDLTGVVVDLERNLVTTPYGDAESNGFIQVSEDQRPTGAWSGPSWKIEKTGSKFGHGTTVRFSVGRMEKTGRGILYYDVKHVEDDGKKRVSYILIYDLKQPK